MKVIGNVLIVDDEPFWRQRIEEIIEREGWAAETAKSGQEAIEKLKHSQFQLGLLDTGLPGPGPEGIELLKHIKENYPDIR